MREVQKKNPGRHEWRATVLIEGDASPNSKIENSQQSRWCHSLGPLGDPRTRTYLFADKWCRLQRPFRWLLCVQNPAFAGRPLLPLYSCPPSRFALAPFNANYQKINVLPPFPHPRRSPVPIKISQTPRPPSEKRGLLWITSQLMLHNLKNLHIPHMTTS